MRGSGLSRFAYWTGQRVPLGPNADLAFCRDFNLFFYGSESPARWKIAIQRLRESIHFWCGMRAWVRRQRETSKRLRSHLHRD